MRARNSSFLLLLVCFLALITHVLADSPVTFEILGDFAYPSGTFTEPHAINNNGDMAGYFSDDSGIFRGFVRYRNGQFSMPIAGPEGGSLYTDVWGANSNRICGFYEGSDLHFHGFVLSGDTYTDFGVDTFLFGMNDAGNLCGVDPNMAFVIIDNVVTYFGVPGALATSPKGINNRDECVGQYSIANQWHGFRRDADGALQYPVDAPGASITSLTAINDQGAMVGEADTPTGIHGIFFQSVKKATLFDYPGASVTVFTGINNHGLICGYYQTTANMTSRGFVVRVRPANKD